MPRSAEFAKSAPELFPACCAAAEMKNEAQNNVQTGAHRVASILKLAGLSLLRSSSIAMARSISRRFLLPMDANRVSKPFPDPATSVYNIRNGFWGGM